MDGIVVIVIIVLTGENGYEVHQALRQLMAEFDGTPERFDGDTLELRQLPDLLMGTSLFAEKRLVIIRELAANKAVWDALPEWLGRVNDDIRLVLVEPKLDKRTKTYKALQKVANIIEHKPWTERDQTLAEKWVAEQAKVRDIKLAPADVRLLVARIGVDQWQLGQALDKLGVLDDVTDEVIREVIEARPIENVFELFETALGGDKGRLAEILATLQVSEDPYMLLGLLSGQAFQLAALAVARPDDEVARDFGVHPYVLSRLRPYANQRGVGGARAIIALFAEADDAMKSSVDPWVAITQVLFAVAETS